MVVQSHSATDSPVVLDSATASVQPVLSDSASASASVRPVLSDSAKALASVRPALLDSASGWASAPAPPTSSSPVAESVARRSGRELEFRVERSQPEHPVAGRQRVCKSHPDGTLQLPSHVRPVDFLHGSTGVLRSTVVSTNRPAASPQASPPHAEPHSCQQSLAVLVSLREIVWGFP